MNKRLKTTAIISGSAALLLVIFYQSGLFSTGKIPPGNTKTIRAGGQPENLLTLKMRTIIERYHAVGTIHSRTEVELSSRITARVLVVNARSGDKVEKGSVLVKLDDTELRSALARTEDQVRKAASAVNAANQAVNKAKAVFTLAKQEYERNKILYAKNVVSKRSMDQATSVYEGALSNLSEAKAGKAQAESALEAARSSVAEAKARLGYATIRAPFTGVVAKQLADPGDLASPGIILITIFDPTRIMFYVPIRESLVSKIKIGDPLSVIVPAINRKVPGKVREIVPSVDPGSRTFLVKVCLLDNTSLMPGMFGTLELNVGETSVLTVPETAVSTIGQLKYAHVVGDDGSVTKRLVRTAPYKDKELIIVAGLKAGERIERNIQTAPLR
jgi:RND family efflux transporter MFP subunit